MCVFASASVSGAVGSVGASVSDAVGAIEAKMPGFETSSTADVDAPSISVSAPVLSKAESGSMSESMKAKIGAFESGSSFKPPSAGVDITMPSVGVDASSAAVVDVSGDLPSATVSGGDGASVDVTVPDVSGATAVDVPSVSGVSGGDGADVNIAGEGGSGGGGVFGGGVDVGVPGVMKGDAQVGEDDVGAAEEAGKKKKKSRFSLGRLLPSSKKMASQGNGLVAGGQGEGGSARGQAIVNGDTVVREYEERMARVRKAAGKMGFVERVSRALGRYSRSAKARAETERENDVEVMLEDLFKGSSSTQPLPSAVYTANSSYVL